MRPTHGLFPVNHLLVPRGDACADPLWLGYTENQIALRLKP